MPKKWKEDLTLEVDQAKTQEEKSKILHDAAVDLRKLADENGVPTDLLVTAFGRKVG